jgi:hypothetical protein
MQLVVLLTETTVITTLCRLQYIIYTRPLKKVTGLIQAFDGTGGVMSYRYVPYLFLT